MSARGLHDLRWYQRESVDALFSYFRLHKTGNPIIALPTGTGKSHVIGGFVQETLQQWPGERFLILTHVKELVEQNADKLLQAWPQAPIGINSAGLKRRDVIPPILFGSIQSVMNQLYELGPRDILIIDECHLVSENTDSRYQKLITFYKTYVPHFRVIGLSASPFRMGLGMITEGGIFNDKAYDMCNIDGFSRLIAEGFMVPLIPKKMNTALDVSNVGMEKGDYNLGQLQDAVDHSAITYAALQECCQIAHDRQSWLIFSSGIEHAEHISDMLNSFGVPTTFVHSKLKRHERDERIAAYKDGSIRAMVNNNILTTGFDDPKTDFIACLRPTMSSGLWVQMLGRGTRPFPGKRNCLVADFARNTVRLGPINDPVIPRKKGEGNGEVPVKICDACGMYNHARAKYCGGLPYASDAGCGAEFSFEIKIIKSAGTEELLRSDLPEIVYFDVNNVIYNRHIQKGTGNVSIRVSYYCGLRQFSEWKNFEGKGPWRAKSREWWRKVYTGNNAFMPETNEQALHAISWVRPPVRIAVWINKELPEVMGHEF